MRKWQIGPLVCVLASCAPSLDWREVRDGDAAVVALFPCRPDRVARVVEVGGTRPSMRLLSCQAQGATFALGHFELDDPAAVAPTLTWLRTAAAANLGASAPAAARWQPPGATPSAEAAMMRVDGRLPDGAPLRMHAAFFAHGRGVWQASVVGAAPDPAVTQVFFDGLRVAR